MPTAASENEIKQTEVTLDKLMSVAEQPAAAVQNNKLQQIRNDLQGHKHDRSYLVAVDGMMQEISINPKKFINKETGSFEIPEGHKVLELADKYGINPYQEGGHIDNISKRINKIQEKADKAMPTKEGLVEKREEILAKAEKAPATIQANLLKEAEKLNKDINNFDKDQMKLSKKFQDKSFSGMRKEAINTGFEARKDISKTDNKIVKTTNELVGEKVKQGVAKSNAKAAKDIKSVIEAIGDAFKMAWKGIKKLCGAAKKKVKAAGEAIKDKVNEMKKDIKDNFIDPIANGFRETINEVKQGFGKVLGKVGDKAKEWSDKLLETNKTAQENANVIVETITEDRSVGIRIEPNAAEVNAPEGRRGGTTITQDPNEFNAQNRENAAAREEAQPEKKTPPKPLPKAPKKEQVNNNNIKAEDLEAAKANLKSTGVDGRAASKERAGIKDPELGKVVDNLKNAGIKEEKSGLAAQNSAGKTPDQGMSIDKK